jgi:ABC-type transport system involved in multi-copper enzyme maturation permease subunit
MTTTGTATGSITSDTSSVGARSAGFLDTLASEWVKLTTLRSIYITLAIGVFLSIAMTGLVAIAIGNTWDSWPAARQEKFEPILMTMAGNVAALIAFSVFGVLAVGGEYANGMIRLTLTATPKRRRVIFAKLILVFGITFVLGIVTTVGMFLVGQAVLASYEVPVPSLGDTDALRLVLGLGAMMPFFALVGVALGVILRSTAAAITTVLGIVWLPQSVGVLLPTSWQEHVLSLLPGAAVDSVTVAHLAESPMYSEPVVGAVVATAWLVAFLGAAYLALTRRDA